MGEEGEPEGEEVKDPEIVEGAVLEGETEVPKENADEGGDEYIGEEVEGEEKLDGVEDEEQPLQYESGDENEAEEAEPEFDFDEGDLKAAAKDKKGKGDKKDKGGKKEKTVKKEKVEKKPKKKNEEKPGSAKKEKGSKSPKKEKKDGKSKTKVADAAIIGGESKSGIIVGSEVSVGLTEAKSSKSKHKKSVASHISTASLIMKRSVTMAPSQETLGSYSSEESISEIDARHSKARRSRIKRRKSSIPSASSVIDETLQKPETKKGKGKGKGKKKGKGKTEEELAVLSEEKEISTHDLEEGAVDEDVPKEPPPKKKKKKAKKPKKEKGKPLSASEKRRLEEEKKKQEEEEAAREAEELRLRLIAEKKMAIEKEKRDIIEQQLRVEQFEETFDYMEEIKKAGFDAYMEDKVKEEWEKYLVCDGRPDPADVPQMNTYLHLWENEIDTMTTELAVYRTNEMYNLLNKLQELMDDPFDVTESKEADWIWIRSRFRDLQKDNLNFCTYRLIRKIDYTLNRIDIPTADFRLKEENFSLCLWVPVQLPIPIPNPRNPSRPRIHMDWPEMSMNVLFPQSLDCEGLVLRAMYVRYNHLSDTSFSYPDPAIPEFLDKDLSEVTANEWRTKLQYKFDKRVKIPPEPVTNDAGEIVPQEPEEDPVFGPDELPPIVPYQRLEPTASDFVQAIEDKLIEDAKFSMKMNLPDKVVNLRKYVILGGVYYLDLFEQPTQPQVMVSYEIFNTNLILPCEIKKAPSYVEYLPPPPPAPGVRRTPEEIEEELMILEKEFEKLTLVTLDLPPHIVWMDVPIICHWNEETKEWSTADVHDFKHIEEKGFVTFRTGRFGAFAVATYKYPNFPFQAWELRPEHDGSVTLQITAAILLIEFHVKDHTVCLSQFQNAPNKGMDAHINVYYKLPKLIRIMREAGVDVFPAFDTFFYVEGTCEKYWPMELKTYYGMAMTANAYNFSWSRWNMTSDYKTIVMQSRLYRFDKPKQLNYSTCMITPLRATMIECTEVSPAFSDEPIEGMKFYADMYHLIRGQSTMATKDRLGEANLAMVNSLAKLLIATRFLSFS